MAATYDETRGGAARARAAAEAVDSLLPKGGRVLELAVGTGIVGAELVARGNLVHGVDLSDGDAPPRADPAPGSCHAADATGSRSLTGAATRSSRSGSCTCSTTVSRSSPRSPGSCVTGGVFVTTTEKSDAGRYADGRVPDESRAQDALAHLVAQAARHGLTLDGATTFPGPPRTTGEIPIYPLVRFRRT